MPRPGCAAAHTSLDAVELVELAVEAALRLELTTVERLRDICHDAARNRPGRAVLQEVLRIRPEGAAPAESYLETRCVQVLRSGGVADFERQVVLQDSCGPIGRVDLRLGHVVIEVVGWVAHHDKLDPDSYRYARLTAAGFYVLPFTFRQIEFDPNHIVNATKAALGGRPGGE